MPNTTAWRELAEQVPESETDWLELQANAHRLADIPGSDSWASTSEFHAEEIRQARHAGSSQEMRDCPRCLARGVRYALLYMGGMDRCGCCQWPGTHPEA